MSEQKQVMGNPFDEDNFIGGGGLWDGKVVTITAAKTKIHAMKHGDGTDVLDDKTHLPILKNVLEITGIADDQEKEHTERWSAGGLLPTPDGDGFLRPDGTAGAFHRNCEMAKVGKYLKASGFDIAKLWDTEKQRQSVGALVGARFLMKGEVTLDKDGKVKKNKKGYDNLRFYPVKFEGYAKNVPAPSGGGGAPSEELTAKAVENVLAVLTESGGKATRAELVRKVAARLAGDPSGNKVVALVAKAEFHKGQPWVVDGTGYTLGE